MHSAEKQPDPPKGGQTIAAFCRERGLNESASIHSYLQSKSVRQHFKMPDLPPIIRNCDGNYTRRCGAKSARNCYRPGPLMSVPSVAFQRQMTVRTYGHLASTRMGMKTDCVATTQSDDTGRRSSLASCGRSMRPTRAAGLSPYGKPVWLAPPCSCHESR